MSSPLVVVTGASGQLGQSLSQLWSEAPLPRYRYAALSRTELDINNPEEANARLAELRPTVIVNAAAFTQVDKAESEQDSAYLTNDAAVATLASWAAENSARLLHVSTDFVFDGKADTPYRPDQNTSALGTYGASKLAGEAKVLSLAGDCSAIVRTSWLYSEFGSNFVKTMLRLMNERDQLAVVDDQIGSPTSTHGLAELIFAMIARGSYDGIYHWTDGGSISWHDFAVEIQKQALETGLVEKAIPIRSIATSEYPTPAQRPAYSVLDRSRAMAEFDCPSEDWQAQLNRVLKALANQKEI